MTTWLDNVRQISNGEPVNAAVSGRPDRAAENNLRYLKSRLDALEAATALHDFDKPVSSAVVVGTPVYWNSTAARYEPALAGYTVNATTGQIQLSNASVVLGICDEKTGPTTGHILLSGVSTVSLAAVVDGAVTAGRYFLSGLTAGKLVLQRSAVGVPVLVYQGGRVFVFPMPTEFLLTQLDYAIELAALPAGTVVATQAGDPHQIDVPDDAVRGWLPADDDIFQGLAPEGALFGYNLAAHDELRALWPPSPISSARITVERPPIVPDALVPWIGGTNMGPDTVRLDANGIWWFNNCYNRAPWPATYINPEAGSSSSSAEESAGSDDMLVCDPTQQMHIVMYFGRMQFANNNYAVTSLTSDNPGLTVRNTQGDPATTGPLVLDLDLALSVTGTATTGATVLKQFSNNNTFLAGPVTEGLLAGDNVSLTSTVSRRSTPGDLSSPLIHQGLVTLAVDLTPGDLELPPDIIKLGDAKERHHAETGLPYIGFPPGRTSRIQMVFRVPSTGLPASPTLTIRTLILGDTTGTLPSLTMTRIIAAMPSAPNIAVALPASDDIASVVYPVAQGIGDAEYVLVESDPFEVTPGDTVCVTIERVSDAYTGEVGVLRADGIVRQAT